MDYLPEISWLLLLGVGAYFFGVPLLILSTFQHDADPEIDYVKDDVNLPEDVHDHFLQTELTLQHLGFEPGELMYLPNQMQNVRVLLQLFINRQSRTGAMSVTMFTEVNGNWNIGNQYVEFSTKARDELEVNSTNATEVGAFPEGQGKLTNWMTQMPDLTQLHSAHCAMADFHIPLESRILRLDTIFGGDEAEYVADAMKSELEEAVRSGYLRLSDDGTCYKATIPGAYRMTWKQLPPFKGLYRSWKYRQALQRLSDVGWSPE